LALTVIILPVVGFAATTAIRSTRSDTYLMGTAVPYYVYGYDLKTDNASAVASAPLSPTAPRLPIAGSGGKVIKKIDR